MVALLVALGGTSFAAVKLTFPPHSVGSTELKFGAVTNSKIATGAVTNSKIATGAVTSSKVADRTLVAADFRVGQLPVGPPGSPGAQGPSGPSGPAGPAGAGSDARWALIGRDGNIIKQSAGLNLGMSHAPASGAYYINFGSSVTGHAIIVTSAFRDGDSGFRGAWLTAICGGAPEGATCAFSNNTSTVAVFTQSQSDLNLEDHAFYIAVL